MVHDVTVQHSTVLYRKCIGEQYPSLGTSQISQAQLAALKVQLHRLLKTAMQCHRMQ